MFRILTVLIVLVFASAPLAKVWNGTAWVDDQAHRWNGSTWVEMSKFRWSGSAWVEIEAAGGGGAASGEYRPNGDLSLGGWDNSDYSTTPPLYLDLDEIVVSPTVGDGLQIHTWGTTTPYEMSVEDITGTVTTLRVYIYAATYSINQSITVDVSQNGSTWEGGAVTTLLQNDESFSWVSVDFTVTWTDTSDFRARISSPAGATLLVDTVYAEANPI